MVVYMNVPFAEWQSKACLQNCEPLFRKMKRKKEEGYMFICPVCGKENETLVCKECGYDMSGNYEKFPTLSLIKKTPNSIEFLKKEYNKKFEGLYKCPVCGKTNFNYVLADRLLVCSECKNPLEDIICSKKRKINTDFRKINEKLSRSKGTNSDKTPVNDNTKDNFFYDDEVTISDLAKKKWNYERWKDIVAVSAGGEHTVGLRKDGTVVAVGKNYNGQCDVSSWRNIVAISAGYSHTVGLKRDGRVVATGWNWSGECNVSEWKDIVAISAGHSRTIGLHSGGTVVSAGWNLTGLNFLKTWKNIVAVSAGNEFAVGLYKDGSVVVTENANKKCDVGSWKDISAISAGGSYIAGLRKDGSVITTENKVYGEYAVWIFKDIVAISAGSDHTVGLRKNGTVVAMGNNEKGECNVNGWKDIIAISAGHRHTVGLHSDGTVVAVGSNEFGQCNV